MRIYRKVIPLRWGDMDAMNHLNNTLYFRLMEEARISWFYEHDMVVGGGTSAGDDGPILASASCDFLTSMTYPCDAVVTQTVTRIGRSSMDLDLTIEGAADSTEAGAVPLLYARGKNVLVWMNYREGRSAPWPERLVRALGPLDA